MVPIDKGDLLPHLGVLPTWAGPEAGEQIPKSL
jgi:hypothetical protein